MLELYDCEEYKNTFNGMTEIMFASVVPYWLVLLICNSHYTGALHSKKRDIGQSSSNFRFWQTHDEMHKNRGLIVLYLFNP